MRAMSLHRTRWALVIASPFVLSCWQGVAYADVLSDPTEVTSITNNIDGTLDPLSDVLEVPVDVPEILPEAVEEVVETVKEAASDPVAVVQDGVDEAAETTGSGTESDGQTVQATTAPEGGSSESLARNSERSSKKASLRKDLRFDRRSQKGKSRRPNQDGDDTRSIAAAGKRVRGTKVLGDSIFAPPRGDTKQTAARRPGGLPFTGMEVLAALLVAAALLLSGAAMLAWRRWRPALVMASLAFPIL